MKNRQTIRKVGKLGYNTKHSSKPPQSKRFCGWCQKKTTFRYNRVLNHSECEVCGFRDIRGM